MRNPYEVLGLDSNASLDDVKRAYREAARQCGGNPSAMKELDEAYDSIVNNFGNSSSGGNYGSNDYASYDYVENQNSEYGDIRAKLNSGRIDDAEMLLDGIPYQRRNAEWYYIKGIIQHRRGWLESAAESFKQAYELEPSNPEYKAAYSQLNQAKKGQYRAERRESENKGCSDPCSMCEALMCADCCCECMGGDLIRCC